MNVKELREKTENELKSLLTKTQKELKDTVESILQRKEKNVKKVSQIKVDIARINTLIRQKELIKKEGK